MFKHEDVEPQPMTVRRDHSATHPPPSPRRRRHSNDRLRGNGVPTTTDLDDMIDALDHDISHIITVRRMSSGGESLDSNTVDGRIRTPPFHLLDLRNVKPTTLSGN